MTQIQLSPEQKKILEKDVNPLVKYARELKIKDYEDCQAARNWLVQLKQRAKKIDETLGLSKLKRSVLDAKQNADNLFNLFMNPFKEADNVVRIEIKQFELDEIRRKKEADAKADADRQEAERAEKDRLEKKAEKAEETGHTEKAESYREQAKDVALPPAIPPPTQTKKNDGNRMVWKGQVTDIILLCKAIGEGRAAPNMVLINQSAINDFAKSTKGSLPVPGVRFYEDIEVVVRSR